MSVALKNRHYADSEVELPEHSPFVRIQCLVQLGQLLNTVRRAQRLEIRDVAGQLRLKPAFLEALESGDWSALPGETYGRGYLRHYATALGLSAEEASLCCQQIQGKVDSRLDYLDIVAPQETPNAVTLWFSLAIILVVVAGLLWMQLQDQSGVVTSAAEPLVPPPATPVSIASFSTNSRPSGPSANHCLNLPAKAVLPCYSVLSPASRPSVILTSQAIYPIWERSWQQQPPTP